MYSTDHNVSPFNDLPPVIVVLAAAIALVELALQAGASGLVGGPEAVGWRVQAWTHLGFSDLAFDQMVASATPRAEWLIRFLTYSFVHSGFTHALFAIVILLALGNFTARVIPQATLLAVFFLCGIAGALAYGTFLETRFVLVGAYPSIYGLIGLYTFLLLTSAAELGQSKIAAFRLILVLVTLHLVFGLIGGGISLDIVADIAGFATGFALGAPALPGGLMRLRDRIRGHR